MLESGERPEPQKTPSQPDSSPSKSRLKKAVKKVGAVVGTGALLTTLGAAAVRGAGEKPTLREPSPAAASASSQEVVKVSTGTTVPESPVKPPAAKSPPGK